MIFPTHIVAVGGLITNDEDNILLVNNPRRGWEFPGGIVEVGEDLVTGLMREVKEEAGIVIDVGELVGIYSNIKLGVQYDGISETPTKVIFDFLGKAVSGELKISDEHIDIGWFERDKVLDMITTPVLYDRTKDMLEFNGKVVYRVYTTNPYEVHKERII